ncbi:MAG: alpha/beta hydrolase [Candidatus Obscuribacterales bacterium]|nr:alpha/beta hydrolase [Candidatus Obscuribacterales bacterium]
MLRNLIVILTLLLVALLPFVTKEHDAETATGIRIVHDISYVDDGSQLHKLDLYLPRTTSARRFPLVVFIHGGGWTGGDKKDSPCFDIANHGFAAASINYRLGPKAVFPAQIHDCKAAIRWLRAHANEYNYNAEKIGVIGCSAGGNLAALLGTTSKDPKMEGDLGNSNQSSSVQAVSDWCGPTDLKSMSQEVMQPRFRRVQPEQFIRDFLGGTVEEVPDLAYQASPINFVTKDAPPFIVIHSIEDPIVPFEQSNEFVKKLKLADIDVSFIKVQGEDHMPMSESNWNAVFDFLNQYLPPPPPKEQ